jgi:hypothetical protein
MWLGKIGSLKGYGMSDGRAQLSSFQLYQLMARESVELRQHEIDRVSPDCLYLLALTNKFRLSQHDKDRLKPLHLAHLAVTEKIVLTQDDKDRLPTALLFRLLDQGCIGMSEADLDCYSATQVEYLTELEAAQSARLISR